MLGTKRELVVVAAVVVAAFVALAAGIYIAWLSLPKLSSSPGPGSVQGAWEIPLEPGLTYEAPILGPTTPLSSDLGGGLWLINAATQGRVQMNFTRYALNSNGNPFQAGTLYGPTLSPPELYGAWTDAASARSALFELHSPPTSVAALRSLSFPMPPAFPSIRVRPEWAAF